MGLKMKILRQLTVWIVWLSFATILHRIIQSRCGLVVDALLCFQLLFSADIVESPGNEDEVSKEQIYEEIF